MHTNYTKKKKRKKKPTKNHKALTLFKNKNNQTPGKNTAGASTNKKANSVLDYNAR